MRKLIPLSLVAIVVALIAFASACSSDNSDTTPTNAPSDTTSSQTAATTPDANGTASATSEASAPGTIDAVEKDGSITLSKEYANSGDLSFAIDNQGKLQHQFVVIKTDLAADQLPLTADGSKVDEASLAVLQRNDDVQPGADATLKLTLPPGNYVIICNVPGHYGLGMHVPLMVTTSGGTPTTAIGAAEQDGTITLKTQTAPTGSVAFSIENQGKLQHQFVVIKTDLPDGELPLTSDGSAVDESQLPVIGSNLDIEPGAKATLPLDLPAGKYVIICNVPGHYGLGMHTSLTIN